MAKKNQPTKNNNPDKPKRKSPIRTKPVKIPTKPNKTLRRQAVDATIPKQPARKWDVDAAYQWYMDDATRSYADVAKQFGIAKQTVENKAKIVLDDGSWETWAEHRQNLADEARKKMDEERKKSIPYREDQHLLQYRNLQIAVSQKITTIAAEGKWFIDADTGQRTKLQLTDARQLADAAKALKIAIDGERVIMGLSTSVATIKPGEDNKGNGFAELFAMAIQTVKDSDVANDA
jgi:hypothetical protein